MLVTKLILVNNKEIKKMICSSEIIVNIVKLLIIKQKNKEVKQKKNICISVVLIFLKYF